MHDGCYSYRIFYVVLVLLFLLFKAVRSYKGGGEMNWKVPMFSVNVAFGLSKRRLGEPGCAR